MRVCFRACACVPSSAFLSFFFFNDTATTEIYTLSLHDALPICPMEDIVDDMRRRDLRIGPFGVAGLGLTAFQISFEYADRDKAQAVVREVVTKFVEDNATAERKLAKAQDGADLKPDSDLISGVPVCEVLDPPSIPGSPVSPNRPAVTATGLLAGLLLGSLLALRRWLLVRQAATPGPHPSYGKSALAAAVVGALAAGLGSFAMPNRYVSTAVLRVVPFSCGSARTAQGEIESTARLRQLTQEILSRGILTELIQRPSINVYRWERARRPMEIIIDELRHRDLRIAPPSPAGMAAPGHLTTFEISFEYADRGKAQAVVRELVTKFTEGFVTAERNANIGKMSESLPLEALEVLDPPSLPASPFPPNRPAAAAAIGLLAGLLLGPLLAWRRRSGGWQHPPSGQYALAATVLGAVVAGIGSFAVPNRYVSTAVLRLVSVDPRTPESVQAAAGHLQEIIQEVRSRASLSEIIARPALQLYAAERRRRSLDEAVRQMSDHDLRIEALRDAPFGGRPTAFLIAFEYSDPKKGLACVRAVVSKFVEGTFPLEQYGTSAARDAPGRWNVPDAYLEVLDPASMPETPISPDRVTISAAGGLAGLLLGIAIARARRRAPHSAPA